MDRTDKEERLHKRRERERYAGNMPYALPPIVGFLLLIACSGSPTNDHHLSSTKKLLYENGGM